MIAASILLNAYVAFWTLRGRDRKRDGQADRDGRKKKKAINIPNK